MTSSSCYYSFLFPFWCIDAKGREVVIYYLSYVIVNNVKFWLIVCGQVCFIKTLFVACMDFLIISMYCGVPCYAYLCDVRYLYCCYTS
jgi:hypothetical protein